MAFTQDNREIGIETPLGKDALLLQSATITAQMGRLFQIEAELLSEKDDVKFEDLIGEKVTLRLNLPGDKKRFFNGHVCRFIQTRDEGNLARYQAVIMPWLWFLTRTSDCRIFQNMTVPDIIKKVFQDAGFSDFELRLSGSYLEWVYCVQYRETDFNFVSRLMEQEGIYYYFKHEDGNHTLVLADAYSAHEAFPDYDAIEFRPPSDGMKGRECVTNWVMEKSVQPGAYALTDFNFEKVNTSLLRNSSVSRSHSQADFEMYDYPGEFDEASESDSYSKIRIQELQAQHEILRGQATSRGVECGSLFSLEEHPRADQNREYIITSVAIVLNAGSYESRDGARAGEGACETSFTAIESQTPFRTLRTTPKPLIQGPQTAIVVGPSGEEIHTDEFGRVKVQFHWDREGKKDENSSCWIRVSQYWAGKQWGTMHIPRMGQEVIVEFLEGDPDRPIITGRVYNGDQTVPYELPANKTQSGIKSRSSKGGSGENFNEIRMEDSKGSEQLFIHAEKNQDIEVENDETHWVGHDRKKSVDHNETTSIGNNRTENVGKDETISIESNRTETVGKDESITISGSRTENVKKKESITIGEDRKESVGKNETISIGDNREVDVGKNDAQQVGKKFSLEAGDEILLKTGKASITMKKDGTITIKGKDIKIEGSGKINIKASSDVTIKGSKINQN